MSRRLVIVRRSHTAGGLAAFGYEALNSNTTGGNNSAFGRYRPLYSNTTGGNNTAVGNQVVMPQHTRGAQQLACWLVSKRQYDAPPPPANNTAVGYRALCKYTGTRKYRYWLEQSLMPNITPERYNIAMGYRRAILTH